VGYVESLLCKVCGAVYPAERRVVCEACFGPVEVTYDFEALATRATRGSIEARAPSLWRYMDLLPINDPGSVVDLQPGFTPLRRADNLARKLGLRHVYLKDDTVNPTYSFKDRPVAVAVSKSREWGLAGVGCASTGNLGAATAAAAAKAGLPCYVFIPSNLDPAKVVVPRVYGARVVPVKGTYDDANRVALLTADLLDWGFVNINIRPYYAEGSKTLAYEACEQLGWKAPDVELVPLGSGLLLTAIHKGLQEFFRLGLVKEHDVRICGSQPEGCAPIARAFREGRDDILPVEKPSSIAESLAIGDPASGPEALTIIRKSGGFADAPTDEEVRRAQILLARTEGLYAEPAGGTVVASLERAAAEGKVDPSEVIVLNITGNGLKTPHVLQSAFPALEPVPPDLQAVRAYLGV
jgi:threonine synthase